MRNTKRILSCILALCLILSMLPMSVFAAETEVEKEYNYAILYTDGTLKITHNNFSSLLYIAWSEDAEKIKKVEFADDLNITAIPKQAFQHCVNLTEIMIPDSVTSIGERAFSECKKLSSITFGASSQLQTIGIYAFNNCDVLESIALPDSVTSIGGSAFNSCDALANIAIPDSVTSIGDRAFSDCKKLSSIALGVNSQLQTIGDYAFNGCDVLESIAIPDTVNSIGAGAFNSCDALASITIPDSVTSIGSSTFSQCVALTSIMIPDTVNSIGDSAFYSCDSLASITIPASVTSIGEYAFNGCGNLTDIYYDGTVESWNSITKGARAIPDGVTIHTTAPDLIITGGTAGTDYTYENGVLDIKAAGTYEIKNVDPATATGDIIKVSAPSGTVNITLSGVVINVSATDLAAFEITGECTTKLILKDGSENSLDSGVDRAGIANHSHNLIITCENAENATHICSSDCGVLRAIGQYYGAGIGGDSDESGSNIIITGGNIVADIVDSQGGAGIGGGLFGSGSGITISGGTVTATSASGAGIGGGLGGNGSNITISGGTVTATSASGAGIGGGANGIGDSITISGGTVTATSVHGVGIGGHRGTGSNIKIAPAANTEIMVNTGANVSEAEELTFSFKEETDITDLVSQKAYFYSEAIHIHSYTYTASDNVITESCICGHSETATITAPENPVYDGTAKEATVAYSDNWQGGALTIAYSEGGNVNAIGVSASIEKDGATASVVYEIAKAKIDKPTDDTTEFVYNGSEQTYAVAENDKYEVSGNKMTNAGNQTVTVSLNDTANYEWADGTTDDVTFIFTIAKATPAQNPEKLTAARVHRGKTLADSDVLSGEFFAVDGTTVLEGTFAWVDDTETINEDTSKKMKFTPDDTNYAEIEIDVAVDSYTTGGGGGVTRYTVQFETNGGSTIANKTVTRNSKLAEPEAPTKDGYSFIGWFTDEELTTAYDFDSKVTKGFTLYAKWTEIEEQPIDPEWENPFTDVDEDDWFYDAVKFVSENSLMNGMNQTTFAPNEKITRAMLVTVLWRMEGEPTYGQGKSGTFGDVPDYQWYTEAVEWAAANEIVKGYGDARQSFGPNDYITREQIAAIMFRYAKYKGTAPTGAWAIRLDYTDLAEISDYAVEAVMYCKQSGLMQGKENNNFAPKDNATRAEIAAILHRLIETNK